MDTTLSKPVKYAVFLVIKHPEDHDKFVSIQRPLDRDEMPGVWGLPAGFVGEDESFEEACVNRAKEKLGIGVKVVKFLRRGNTDRGEYILHGEEFLVEIVSGEIDVSKCTQGTKYADWKWALCDELREASSKGSLCSSLYLDFLGKGSEMKYSN